jgi:acylphosphatase
VVRYRVVVTGRVQGVWFRESCRREAAAAGVTGWIRNAADGSVEAVLEGEPDAVERVLAWMRVGPRHAVVANVEVHTEPPVGETTFAVR